PLETWQQFQSWSRRQSDHCLVVPLAGLLHAPWADEQPHVFRVGSQLHAYGAAGGKMQYAVATALGKEASDFQAPLKSLFAQLRASGWEGDVKTVRWSCALTADLESEQVLLAELAQIGVVQARLQPLEGFSIGGGKKASSSLPQALVSSGSRAIQAPLLDRMAWFSEAYV